MANKFAAKTTWLIYRCAVCGQMVNHRTGPHWMETGTILFCPECKGETTISLYATGGHTSAHPQTTEAVPTNGHPSTSSGQAGGER